jgi:hypothetical protein
MIALRYSTMRAYHDDSLLNHAVSHKVIAELLDAEIDWQAANEYLRRSRGAAVLAGRSHFLGQSALHIHCAAIDHVRAVCKNAVELGRK